MENNTLNSIDGATALKLDESYQIEEEEINNSVNSFENNLENQSSIGKSTQVDQVTSSIPSGVSIESASYIENNNLEETDSHSDMIENNEEEDCVVGEVSRPTAFVAAITLAFWTPSSTVFSAIPVTTEITFSTAGAELETFWTL